MDICFHSFVNISGSGIAGSYGNSVFNLLGELPSYLPDRLHCPACPQQCPRAPVSPHLHQQLLLSVSLITTILVGVKWHLIVDLTGIPSSQVAFN